MSNYRDITIFETNFPAWTATDFVLLAATSRLYPTSKTGMLVAVELESLIGRPSSVEVELTDIKISAIAHTRIDKRLLDKVFTVDLLKDSTVVMQVFVAFELDHSTGKPRLGQTSHVWATLTDPGTWKIGQYTYPISIDNMSWKIPRPDI